MTRKKIKVVGTEKYINQTTGALEEMQVISIEERDADFHKIWLWHIADALDLIGNQKIKVLCYIMENINRENQFIGTQRNIAKKLKISTNTVITTIRALQKSNFLQMQQAGVYRVNPEMIFKGGKNERMNILIEYKNTTEEKKKGKNNEQDVNRQK